MRLQYSLAFLEAESKKKTKKNHWLEHFQNLRISLNCLYSQFLFSVNTGSMRSSTDNRLSSDNVTKGQGQKPNAAQRGSNRSLSQDMQELPWSFREVKSLSLQCGAWAQALVEEQKIQCALRVEA